MWIWIIQNASSNGLTSLGFTVPQSQLNKAKEIIENFDHDIGERSFDSDICKGINWWCW